jgi:hypothetical protein
MAWISLPAVIFRPSLYEEAPSLPTRPLAPCPPAAVERCYYFSPSLTAASW